jgi:hypothetical protein
MVGNTGIEPVVPEAADLQSAESPLILLPQQLGLLILLLTFSIINLERDDRIELTTKGWKPLVLPLN